MVQQDQHIIRIHKHLTGQLSPAETQQLQAWLQAHPDNRALYENTQKSWAESQNYKADYRPDTEKSWEKLNRKISDGKVIAMPARRRWMSVAAAILLLMGGAFLWLNNTKNTTENWITVNTKNETKDITLTDGSRVFLNKNTVLRYRENFDTYQNRTVKMTGEAFFEVTKSSRPFEVITPDMDVQVLGTSFNVNATPQQATQVTVKSGKVQVSNKAKTQKTQLIKGEQAQLTSNGKLQKTSPKTLNDLAWKTQRLEFDATPLETVFEDVSKYFDVKIDAKQLTNKCLHTGDVIKGDKLSEVLKDLEQLHGVKITTTKTGYTVSSSKC